MPLMPRAMLIHNPVAGPRNIQREVAGVAAYIKRHGWTVDLRVTERPGDATALARAAADAGYDAAIAAGGDGTVNEVVNGLVGRQTALGVLPVVVGNLWAKQIGLPTYTLANPLRLHDAAEAFVSGSVRPIDVGRVNGRHFLCWAGIGLDAQVTWEMEPRARHTKRLGILPYIIATITGSARGCRWTAAWCGDGRSWCWSPTSSATAASTSAVRRYWTTGCSTCSSSRGWASPMR